MNLLTRISKLINFYIKPVRIVGARTTKTNGKNEFKLA